MKIGVIGSINTDIIYQIDHLPKVGESMFGNKYDILSGGKGANQAVILNSLERDVVFLGAVGTDIFSYQAKKNFEDKNLKSEILVKEGNSGLAIIQLANKDNQIVVFKGSNDLITKEDIDNFFNKYPDIELIVSQAEINLNTIEYLINLAYDKNIKIIMNPAPAMKLKKELIDKVTYLIPNEIEAEVIFNSKDLKQIVKDNLGKVLITLGKDGVMYFDEGKVCIMPSQKIEVIDTTGAGDSFVAGFTSGIAKELSLKEAIKKGIEVASITCKYIGAQTSYKQIEKEFKL